jgi:hypothetical protein
MEKTDNPQGAEYPGADRLFLPTETVKNFAYSETSRTYPPPFATGKEAFGFLSGSENDVLVTKRDPVFSKGFVQCSGVLVRNRELGMVSIIHQSVWSDAASIILSLQRPYDLDVIRIEGHSGTILAKTIDYFHKSEPAQFRNAFDRIDRSHYLNYPKENRDTDHLKHQFGRSVIKGLTTEEMERMFDEAKKGKVGRTNFLGKIIVPVPRSEIDRFSVLYRPNENVIRIFDTGSKQLFKFGGFPK